MDMWKLKWWKGGRSAERERERDKVGAGKRKEERYAHSGGVRVC